VGQIFKAMAKTKGSVQGFERGAAADVWRHTLSQIPYIYGRLAYLGSLRNANTGRYEHHGLAQLYSADKTHGTLLESHEAAFADWLNYDLAHQESDLGLYLGSLGGDLSTVLTAWEQLGTYKNMIPLTASPAQRELYLMDLEALLQVLRASAGAS
jgi:hypothetical protein